ncbi:sugar ABC transporter permease [Herbiconiux moechotypicola]|uniref:Sugar ABC transporter permease n=1 Tax=Herbiconiux moechotypicola TaxID=637393 RepID=A0ABN3E7I0_9MICO|nr:sugar ABC transporter permease [Herbiconiux moechotypicola]MCS5732010.1 sugar ABC transporter permease [Herbiconiux moechotypicola]
MNRSVALLKLVFLTPAVVGLGVFAFVPIVASVVLSLFHWDLLSAPTFAGADNYAALVQDASLWSSLVNTLGYVVIGVIAQIAISLGLALLVDSLRWRWVKAATRSVFFFPLVLSAASVSIFMKYFFDENFGVVNWFLSVLGVPAVPWFTSPVGAYALVIIVYVWQNVGFTFLLFLGGLAQIPEDVREAAMLDGAGPWQRFRSVTMPLLSPTTLTASVMAIISGFQIFEQPFVLTAGGPGDSTQSMVMSIYEKGFRDLDFGSASAIGVVLLLIILLVTAVQFRLSRRFVFYQ